MPLRPEYPASEKEREVFVQNLPLSIYMDEQLRERFQGSGTIEEVFLLKDDLTQTATGKGYVRFASHASAAACIEANSPGEASGEVTAAWSESERACQRQSSIYGADVHAVFAEPGGTVLKSVLTRAKVGELWMMSGACRPRQRNAPPMVSRQLHFSVECDADEFEELRA